MGFRVYPDGSITCDTLAEALEVQRAIQAKAISQAATTVTYVNGEAAISARFIEGIANFKGQDISGDKLAEILGVSSKSALGPKLRVLKRLIPLDQHLERTRHRSGVVMWKVK